MVGFQREWLRAQALVASSVLLSASAVAAKTQQADLDGDGLMDKITLDGHGTLIVKTTKQPSRRVTIGLHLSPSKVSNASLRVSPPIHGHRLILVEVDENQPSAPKQRTTLVLKWHKDNLDVVTQLSTGPQGRDGEWQRLIHIEDDAVILYETRADISRCDGAIPYIYPRAYDPQTSSFRAVDNWVRVSPNARRLKARSKRRLHRSATFSASATNAGPTNARALTPPREIDDGNLDTHWAVHGGAHGAFVTMTSQFRTPIRSIQIIPGNAKSRATFTRGNRLKSVALLVGKSLPFLGRFP